MHASTTCRIVFTATSEQLESAADYLDEMQRGEYFFDEEEDYLVLLLEEDLDLNNKNDVLDFIESLYKDLNKEVDIHAIGTLNAIESNSHQKFECQYNNNFFRYRETDWRDDLDVDEDLSYEEFEEENYVDVDEDEYDERIHRAHEGVKDDDEDIYGDWEYLD